MSIEWLLATTTVAEVQKKPSKRPHNEDVLSDKAHSSDSREQNKRTEYFSSNEMQNQHPVLNMQCSCGCTGNAARSKTDFKLLRTDKNGFAYFECLNCLRHLRYNPSTGKIKIQKGLLGVMFGKFS
jgi:hypothetical protein